VTALWCAAAAAQVVSSINNLIIGKLYIDHGGTMRVTSSASGLACRLKFREQGVLRMREAHEVGGGAPPPPLICCPVSSFIVHFLLHCFK
jgi:hypothetical protein